MLSCTESICLMSSAASASKASCRRSWSSLEVLLNQLRAKPLSCEESLTETMWWQVPEESSVEPNPVWSP